MSDKPSEILPSGNSGAGSVPWVNCSSVNMVACELPVAVRLRCNFSKGCFEEGS